MYEERWLNTQKKSDTSDIQRLTAPRETLSRRISANTIMLVGGKSNFLLYTERKEERMLCYQIIVVLEGVVQGGDPLAVSVYQHIALLPKTRRLQKEQ